NLLRSSSSGDQRSSQPNASAYGSSGSSSPPFTSVPMIGRPWLASTTSGALGPDTASLSVLLRSSNERATRLIVTFGYFCWNCSLSCLIWAAWPPRTSWSQTVSVTSPAAATSGFSTVLDALSSCSLAFSSALPPGDPHPAPTSAASIRVAITHLLIPLPPSSILRPPEPAG